MFGFIGMCLGGLEATPRSAQGFGGEVRCIGKDLVTSSFLLLVVRPGAPSSVLAPSSDALCS